MTVNIDLFIRIVNRHMLVTMSYKQSSLK